MDNKEIIKSFATNLRVERARKNYSQEFLAEKAEITPEYLSRIEKEKYSPSLVVIVKLAAALDVDVNTLISLKDLKKCLKHIKSKKQILICICIRIIQTVILQCEKWLKSALS